VEWLSVTLQIYRRATSRAATLALRNWPVLGSVFAYSAIVTVAANFAVLLGIMGGFLLSLVSAACMGSFLYLVEMMVRTAKVSWEDFGRSFSAYLWDVIGVMFILWIFQLVAVPVLLQSPQGGLILLCIHIAMLVFFNAVPELIYLGHHRAMELLAESYRFVADNWIEWFPPNIILMVGFFAIWRLRPSSTMAAVLQTAALALFGYFSMVLRGLLFIELAGSSRRGRAFRYRSM
jgi:hypothetical protein